MLPVQIKGWRNAIAPAILYIYRNLLLRGHHFEETLLLLLLQKFKKYEKRKFMNQSVILMEEDHANINRALGVIRNICLQLMQGGEVPDEDFREIIEFVREYADKHHHGKEEKYLFPVMVKKLGPVG